MTIQQHAAALHTDLGAAADCLKLRLKDSRPLNERLMLASSDAGTAWGSTHQHRQVRQAAWAGMGGPCL